MALIREWDPWDYTKVIRSGWVAPNESKNKNLKRLYLNSSQLPYVVEAKQGFKPDVL